MLTKKTPETIRATLNVRTFGVENTLQLTYNNRDQEQLQAFVEKQKSVAIPKFAEKDPISFVNASVVLHLVASFDDGTDSEFPLNVKGLISMENTYPGILIAMIRGYHQARTVTIEKN